MERSSYKANILHQGFEISVFIKGLGGVLDVVWAFLFLFITPDKLTSLLSLFTQPEILEDPNDFVVNHILKWGNDFSLSTQHFVIMYLFYHGIIKILLTILLYKKVRWAYPLALIFLGIFIGYQIYRYTNTHAAMLLVLSVFDLILIYLTSVEYLKITNRKA